MDFDYQFLTAGILIGNIRPVVVSKSSGGISKEMPGTGKPGTDNDIT
jgi:hypothetical protein